MCHVRGSIRKCGKYLTLCITGEMRGELGSEHYVYLREMFNINQ